MTMDKSNNGGTRDLNQTDAESYWKHPDYSMVIKVAQAANGALSASIHTLNPTDRETRSLLQEVASEAPKSRFTKMLTSVDPSALMGLCGYSTHMDLKQTSTKKWTGEVRIEEAQRTIGLNVDMTNPNVMKLEAFEPSMPLVTKDTELKRVSTPPPPCSRP